MNRRAECACGQVSAVVSGDPAKVFVCHCDYCQKRTGSVFNVSCYFCNDQVLELNGDTRTFSRSANSIGIIYEFCPACGTTVHWSYGEAMIARYPEMANFRGFAVGCFVDPDFPAPTIEHQRQYAHHWVPEIPNVVKFDGFADPNISVAGS